ncbi:MAG: outer membrane beta-barrel protein, partial [Planctomycetota bacterium]
NFFYSHAITMYNSEPFTHTGVLASYAASEDTTLYGGWTAGWDTGFEQFGEGSNFLGGISTSLSEDVVMAYMATLGDFGARGSDGYMQSIVLDVALSDQLSYVAQSDILHVGSTGEDTLGINQYLFYTVNDQVTVGGRFEWWKADAINGYAPYGGTAPASGSVSHYSATFGANYQINSNLMLRPEYRYDWSEGADYSEGIFGVDLVATF